MGKAVRGAVGGCVPDVWEDVCRGVVWWEL